MNCFKISSVIAVTLALAGCGGSGGSEVSRVISGANALNIGTQSATQTQTGLPFAGDDPTGSNPLEEPVKLRFVRFVTDYDNDRAFIVVSEEIIDVEVDMSDNAQGTVTFNGERVRIIDDEGVLSNGQLLETASPDDGDFAVLLNLYTYSDSFTSGFDSDAYAILGAETNPETVAMLSDTVTYASSFFGYSNLLDSSGAVVQDIVELSGNVEVIVEFGSGDVNGSLDFATVAADPGDLLIEVDVGFDETQLLGNGFSTTARQVNACPMGSSCSSDITVGGALFGLAAEELGGLAGIDYTETDLSSGGAVRILGAGGFVAEDVSEIVVLN